MKKQKVTIISTLYKRSDYYETQINAFLNQTYAPEEIIFYQNENHFTFNLSKEMIAKAKNKNIIIKHVHSKDHNYKFHGRFTLPLISDSDYIAIFDDDTIPGNKWIENCLKLCKEKKCILGANGRVLNKECNWVNSSYSLGDGQAVLKDTFVDFVGHCWFFKRDWIYYMWMQEPNTLQNGEDIHFAASCFINGGIRCMVPKQVLSDRSDWGDSNPELGWDDNASWKKPQHHDQRKEIITFWAKKGWKGILARE